MSLVDTHGMVLMWCSDVPWHWVHYEGQSGILRLLLPQPIKRSHPRSVHRRDSGRNNPRLLYCQSDQVGIEQAHCRKEEGIGARV